MRTIMKYLLVPIILTFSLFTFTTAYAATIYVNSAAAGANDGSSWADAYTDLQSALNHAAQTPGKDSIWVAKGKYVPSVTNPNDVNGINGGRETFLVPDKTSIYGGFAGNEKNLKARDIQANKTILSGDIAGNDLTDRSDPVAYYGSKTDNVYHVLTLLNVDVTLDGLVIQDGYARGDDNLLRGDGGGVFVDSGVTNVKNVVIRNNDTKFVNSLSVTGYGAGIRVHHLSGAPGVLNVSDSLFEHNYAGDTASSIAGKNTEITVKNTKFLDNSSFTCGVIYNDNGFLVVTDSLFENSYSEVACSVITLTMTDPELSGQSMIKNSVFRGNSGATCGAIFLANTSDFFGGSVKDTIPIIIENNLFVDNEVRGAPVGSFEISCGVICNYSYNAIITGNIFLNNRGVSGGAVCLTNVNRYPGASIIGTTTMKSNVFYGNSVGILGEEGAGVIKVELGQIANINGNLFYQNTTNYNGGAIAVYDATADIYSNAFIQNDALLKGEEIYASNAQLNNVLNSNIFFGLNPNSVVIE